MRNVIDQDEIITEGILFLLFLQPLYSMHACSYEADINSY